MTDQIDVDANNHSEPQEFLGTLNSLFGDLIDGFPRGISNTSTSKYNAIQEHYSNHFGLPVDHVYATGAATRASNIDTRLAQGNQRSASTELGLVFLRIDPTDVLASDLERATNSLGNTCRKFIQGLEGGAQYGVLVLHIQYGSERDLHVTLVMYSTNQGLANRIAEETGAPMEVCALEASAEAAVIAGSEQLHIQVEWDNLDPRVQDPCRLVSLGQPMNEAAAALHSGKNVVFLGPPGTGKTELAVCLARTLGVEYDLVTATSDWTTFDTIGGYLPQPGAGDSVLDFVPSVVASSFERGTWIIVDELNRADIDKAFGELFTLLSEKPVKLPYRKTVDGEAIDVVLIPAGHPYPANSFPIYMPTNWAMIGTMNTFDKSSLYTLSYAFMRRFAFVEVNPPPPEKFANLISEKFEELGEQFTETLEAFTSFFDGRRDCGLGRIGLTVGPSIPLDIIKHLQAVVALAKEAEVAPKSEVVRAIEMYLFSQFEGKDREHREIIAAIRECFSLTDDEANTCSQSLARWTGFEDR